MKYPYQVGKQIIEVEIDEGVCDCGTKTDRTVNGEPCCLDCLEEISQGTPLEELNE